ncbi:hypothetical protein COV53_00215 [Candidatus Gottesmanbacteria bacterium CG11_big_fil_rev_8_21_14_0_20_37_11]|uniref:DUF86 domain-containing protein n=3 Tax=Microgenomates group TaxID=1794810 RepID=A0A2M7EJL6_9BACT|nr:MAG: hypothetical protein COV53_00215 [Candidatus Gottesmanbacteria bacterium CG11_big_fil_rev_8_21_14_0_20_37_11]PIV70771.1 MAG: hypothetical protein COW57_03380 [Candidatus Roizmanbacteria bacterium CG17_big_fil_post_rev_8_21_14_2_50_39_7]PJC81232.1 MAG: hypothetical protein CO007_05775 [Candidatus Roizmanbacteria bacterium CG_4_8_14_3_um_filter_36_10]
MDKDNVYLKHILDAIRLISEFTKDMNKHDFRESEITIHATVRQFEIIGEAVKHISNKLREAHPEIPWRGATGTRDNLIHEYFNVDLDQVWETIEINLPDFKKKIEKLVK